MTHERLKVDSSLFDKSLVLRPDKGMPLLRLNVCTRVVNLKLQKVDWARPLRPEFQLGLAGQSINKL